MINLNSIYIPKKIFNSLDLKHQIEISIIDNIAWFNIIKLDYEFCKTFLILLKSVIEFFCENNVKYIKQYLNKEDLEFLNKSTSSYVEVDSEYSIFCVSIKLEDFINQMVNLLGIKPI